MCALHPLRHRPLISPPTCRAAAPACQDYYVVAAVRDPAKMHAAAGDLTAFVTAFSRDTPQKVYV